MDGIVPVELTPVQRAEHVSRALGSDVWVKRDDLTHPRYGGNKVRKLGRLLAAARARGATDVVTLGAVGSHHVLATTVHAGALGFAVHAALVPQPYTAHAEETVRAALAQGADLRPAPRGDWQVPFVVLRELARLRAAGRRPYLVSLGGSTPLGAAGYVDAVAELGAQIARGEMPGWPDVMLCPLGSGGTHAGLAAGVRAFAPRGGADCEVVGVRVTAPIAATRSLIAWMARRALAVAAPGRAAQVRPLAAREIRVMTDQFGRGYGYATPAGEEATALFARDGLVLDPTYTAKAAAGLVAMARRAPGRRYLLWHTLSSAPLGPLLGDAHDGGGAAASALPEPLAALLVR